MCKITDINKNCFTCKYCGVEDFCHECECEKTGLVINYDLNIKDFPVCDNYACWEDDNAN